MLLRPLSRMGARRWRHDGREKRSRIANEVVATEARTIIIVQRYRWLNGSCLANRPEARPI
jgi:type II secretory pathway component PulJ